MGLTWTPSPPSPQSLETCRDVITVLTSCMSPNSLAKTTPLFSPQAPVPDKGSGRSHIYIYLGLDGTLTRENRKRAAKNTLEDG